MSVHFDQVSRIRPSSPEPARFLDEYPDYERTRLLDDARATEYAYLDRDEHVYLDYTAAGLAATAQFREHAERLGSRCFGNPHSENPASRASTDLVEQARAAVLDHFNASSDEYTAVFVANATAACRLVAEAFPFDSGTRFVATADNHNSVNGIREYARAKHSRVQYVSGSGEDLRVDDESLRGVLSGRGRATVGGTGPRGGRGGQGPATVPGSAGLFAYPAQSNFTGVRHPLHWVPMAQDEGFTVLLDAAAFVPTGRLDLSVVHPDFVAVSWYKVFGYPTGVGCLIARRDALERLDRPWFSGGTIGAVSVRGDWHTMAGGAAGFEDGTVNFLAIPDVEVGLRRFNDLGVDTVSRRVRILTAWLLDRLCGLAHSNGAPMVRIYGPRTTQGRGGTVAFNFLDPQGAVVDERLVERDAAAARISLRTGCFCNPGAGEIAFGISADDLRGRVGRERFTIDEYLRQLRLPSGGAVRVSLGLVSNVADVERFLTFAEKSYRDRRTLTDGLPPRERC